LYVYDGCVHTSGIEGEGFEAWVRIWFSRRVGCGCGHSVWVCSGELRGTMWVRGSEVLEGWVHSGGWGYINCWRVVCGSAGCKVDAMRGWKWVPCFTLEDVELVGVVLFHGLRCFLSMAGCTFCWWWLHVGFDADAGCWRKIWGDALWVGWIWKAGLFRWVWGCGGGLGLCSGWGLGDCMWSFAGQECGCVCGSGAVGAESCGGGFCRCIFVFVFDSQSPTSWIGDAMDEGGLIRIRFPSDDVS
jgi:hypothetical protein